MERLSGLDASFLYLENSGQHMHVAMTMVLDPSTMPGGYSFEKIKDFYLSRAHLVPPFYRRVVRVPFNLAHPIWVDDPNFDIDYHVRRIGAPAPGGRRELADLAAQIASVQLDRTRPLWEAWVIEGLKHDRIGVVTKVHHCAIDGASGADLMVHLFDLEPSGREIEPHEPIPEGRVPNDLELLGHAARSRWRRTVNLPGLLGRTARSATTIVRGRRDPAASVGAAPLTAPPTPFNGNITPHRKVAFARLPLPAVKEVKQQFGTTVNDVILAVCGGALRRYLLRHDALPDTPLIASCPTSVRRDDDDPEHAASANRVSALFTNLATNIDDPAERLFAIQKVTKGAKEEHNAIGANFLQDWAEFAAPNLFNLASRLYSSMRLADSHRPIHNVVISNVPGPPFPLYYAGAEMVAAYPMGPLIMGAGLNITVLSYRDSVDFGFMACRELMGDVWDLAGDIEAAFAELQKAAGVPAKKRVDAAHRARQRAAKSAKGATRKGSSPAASAEDGAGGAEPEPAQAS